MDLHYKQELQVGLLVLVALAFVIAGMIWLSGRSLGGGVSRFSVQFESVQGLTENDPVHIAGVRVGRVSNIRIEGVRQVVVRLEVSRRFEPRRDASVSIKSLDFLGAKFMEYSPGTDPELLPFDSMITGGGEDDLAATATGLADQASDFMAQGSAFLSDDLAQQLHVTMAAAERALDVVAQVGSGSVMADATAAMNSLQSAAARLDSTLANPSIQQSVSQLDEITEGVSEMVDGFALLSTSLASVMERLDSNDGTVGRILNDTTLHQDMHEVLQSLRALLDDIRENPGRYGPRAIKLF